MPGLFLYFPYVILKRFSDKIVSKSITVSGVNFGTNVWTIMISNKAFNCFPKCFTVHHIFYVYSFTQLLRAKTLLSFMCLLLKVLNKPFLKCIFECWKVLTTQLFSVFIEIFSERHCSALKLKKWLLLLT